MGAATTRLKLRVSPGARRPGIAGRHGDAWKIRVAEPPEDGANRLVGTVRDVSYIGVSTQYIIDTPAGDELVAIVQNAGRGARHLERGESVQLLWDPEHTFVITDEGHVPTVEELI